MAFLDRSIRLEWPYLDGVNARTRRFLSREWRHHLHNSCEQRRLVLLDDHEIIAARRDHWRTQRLLVVQRIARQHASLPVDLPDGLWRHGRFGCVLARSDHTLSQHASEVVAEGVTAWMGCVGVAPWRNRPR